MKIKIKSKQHNSKSCIVCGLKNELGLKAHFYELENNELVALCTIKNEHQSYPGRTHGGITAALLDETIGRAISITNPGIWGVTVDLNVKYKKPIPLDVEVKVVGRITMDSKRLFEGTGEIILQNGDIAATASGKYMKLPLDKISDSNFEHSEWFIDTNENPEFIDL
ncbi:MAG: putative thioesterase [Haloplasmataceae bacterium]|jgi:uncharacterized protein (TIGR00369 family)|nr:putative thioesterase [Haloplasmataceae bacterium]